MNQESKELTVGGKLLSQVVDIAMKIPGMEVNRREFLQNNLAVYYERYGEDLIDNGPIKAGVPLEEIKKIGNAVVNYHTALATSASAALGLPGGLAMAGTIPADLGQFYGQLMIVGQKLAYLYGLPDLKNGTEKIKMEMLFGLLAIMFGQTGNQLAQIVLNNYAKQFSKIILISGGTKLPPYQMINLCAKLLGFDKLTKKAAAQAVRKAVPFVGAFLSGIFTLGTFKPAGNRLNNYFYKEYKALSK